MICSGAQLLIQMLYQTSLLYPRDKAGVFLIINSTHVIYINHSYRTHIEGPHTMICSRLQIINPDVVSDLLVIPT